MAALGLDPEKLRSQAAVYSAASRDVEAAVQSVNRTNGEISEQWRGAVSLWHGIVPSLFRVVSIRPWDFSENGYGIVSAVN